MNLKNYFMSLFFYYILNIQYIQIKFFDLTIYKDNPSSSCIINHMRDFLILKSRHDDDISALKKV